MSLGEIKPYSTIVYNNDLFVVLDCEHAKSARGSGFCRAKLKNLKTDQTIDCTLRDSDNVEIALTEKRKLQYSYHEGELYHFMDMETFEDLILNKSKIEEFTPWLKDNLGLEGLYYNNELVSLELPATLELKVVETDPGFRGNTVKSGTKPAKLETGVSIQVPLFVDVADIIKVDTRSKTYLGRV